MTTKRRLPFPLNEWRTNPAIRSLTFFDRAVFLEITLLLLDSTIPGVALLNGTPMSDDAIGNAIGIPNISGSLQAMIERGLLARHGGALTCDKMRNLKIEAVKPEVKGEQKELYPHVFLSDEEVQHLLTIFKRRELAYILQEMSNHARQAPKLWLSKYSSHSLVAQNWRRRRLEQGLIWIDEENRFGYPKRGGEVPKNQSVSERQVAANLEIRNRLKQLEEQDETIRNP